MKIFQSVLVLIFALNANLVMAKQEQLGFAEVEKIFSAIRKTDWMEVENLSRKIIDYDIPAKKNIIGRLRYIYLIAVAKNLEAGKIKYSDVKGKLDIVLNKLIVQPWHPVKSSGGSCFNKICDSSEVKAHKATAQANSDGTQIYSFEYFDMGQDIELASFDGLNARMGGLLVKIEINDNLEPAMKANKGVSWYFRYHVRESFIQFDI